MPYDPDVKTLEVYQYNITDNINLGILYHLLSYNNKNKEYYKTNVILDI